MNNDQAIGLMLRMTREVKDIPQNIAAKDLGLSSGGVLSGYEAGNVTLSYSFVKKAVAYYGITMKTIEIAVDRLSGGAK